MKRIALVDTAREEWQALPFVAIRIHRCDDAQCDKVHAWSFCIGWLNFSLWVTFD